MCFKVKAPFSKNNGATWFWMTWTENLSNGNKHLAIITKAKEIDANAWDFGQTRYELFSEAGF